MRVLVRECVCDHWGGKEPWPGGYTEEPQRGEPFEQSLNPGGLQVWLAVLLSMLGHNLKGDQRAVPQSSKALFLPPHLSLSLSLNTLSLHIFHILLQTTVHFNISLWILDNNYTTCAQNIQDLICAERQCWLKEIHHVSEMQCLTNKANDILASNSFQMSFYISKHRFSEI